MTTAKEGTQCFLEGICSFLVMSEAFQYCLIFTDFAQSFSNPISRASDKKRILIIILPGSSPYLMFENLLELSNQDNSNKWLKVGFGKEIIQVVSIEVNFYTSYPELCIIDSTMLGNMDVESEALNPLQS